MSKKHEPERNDAVEPVEASPSNAEKDKKVRVDVFNTGEHIPEESLDKVWIKLYKVDKSRNRQFGGFGLGLSIVKAIMEELKNGYGVENCQDGVNFWFELDKAK